MSSIFSFNKPEVDPSKTDVKTAPATVNHQQADSAIQEIAKQEGKETGKEKVVVIDGPLSHVYTQALNIALSNESVAIMVTAAGSAADTNIDNLPDSTTGPDDDAEYVYAIGDRVVEAEDAMEAFNSISRAVCSGRYKKVHLAIEGALSAKMCKRMSMVMESAMKMGVNVIAKSQVGTEAAVLDLQRSMSFK